ncbi:MAG TPA: protein kinase, partial [Pirellulaceae bacterium]|nr:protein kinase [Pirellulaceae bacterium]
MHSDSGSDRFDNCIAELGGLAIPTFRLEFETDPQFRIENFLPTLETWLNNFPSDVRQDVKNLVVADLLFNEMELRFKAGQRFGTAEYELRFPAFASRIRLAISNLTRKYPDFIESHSIVALTRAQIDEDDGTGSENTFRHAGIGEHDRQIPQSLGPYVSIVPIKTGGFGAVCKAVDQRDQRVVALKFPRGGRLRRKSDLKTFVAEADKAMSLDHPGIVRTIAVEKADGLLAIVQEFIEGGDLKSTDNRPRSHREIVELIAMVADALDYAHRKGIYHRDLKPGNILVDVNGRPYIADFGLALDERDQLFSPSQRCGTTHYMAPELVAGLTRRVDGRSDIWSLGVIFYELLTNRKPFDGVTEEDVYDQIEHKDPRPPRQIDASIDRELQRICLKCLERQQRDRYSSADELADDLRHWMHRSLHVRQPSDQPKFVPKGLKSYTAEDAAFFLDLLPGPRDRYGLPDSIRFWKKRISNANDSESCVPIGVIFGPSGSGKSSYVKAGLMPQLPDDILSIYLEANQVDTETRLLRELRKRIPDIPANLSLPATMQGLALGQWLPAEKRKVLIVIDQFEQRLAMADDIAVSRLVKALRYCDGEVLQCLVLARDDFLMALSRFMDALEMDLKEGENAQAIDLFDRRHACKVLEKLGRAYDKLPTDPSGISEEQQRFLDVAIDQLIQDEHVICVHLTMFAEMFRHRPWTLLELDQVGGVSGTGEKFLEATFG